MKSKTVIIALLTTVVIVAGGYYGYSRWQAQEVAAQKALQAQKDRQGLTELYQVYLNVTTRVAPTYATIATIYNYELKSGIGAETATAGEVVTITDVKTELDKLSGSVSQVTVPDGLSDEARSAANDLVTAFRSMHELQDKAHWELLGVIVASGNKARAKVFFDKVQPVLKSIEDQKTVLSRAEARVKTLAVR